MIFKKEVYLGSQGCREKRRKPCELKSTRLITEKPRSKADGSSSAPVEFRNPCELLLGHLPPGHQVPAAVGRQKVQEHLHQPSAAPQSRRWTGNKCHTTPPLWDLTLSSPHRIGTFTKGWDQEPGPAGTVRPRESPPTQTPPVDHIASFVHHSREAASESRRGKRVTMAAIVTDLGPMLAPESSMWPQRVGLCWWSDWSQSPAFRHVYHWECEDIVLKWEKVNICTFFFFLMECWCDFTHQTRKECGVTTSLWLLSHTPK